MCTVLLQNGALSDMELVHCGIYVISLFDGILPRRWNSHYGDIKWPSWHLKLPISRVFVQQFVHTDNKEPSKVCVIVPLWGEPPVTGGFPAQRGQQHRKFSIWCRHNAGVELKYIMFMVRAFLYMLWLGNNWFYPYHSGSLHWIDFTLIIQGYSTALGESLGLPRIHHGLWFHVIRRRKYHLVSSKYTISSVI